MTAMPAATLRIAPTIVSVSLVRIPFNTCWAINNALFQRVTKNEPIFEIVLVPLGVPSMSAVKTLLSTPWMKFDTVVHGALVKLVSLAAGTPVSGTRRALVDAAAVAVMTSLTNSGSAIIGNTTAGA